MLFRYPTVRSAFARRLLATAAACCLTAAALPLVTQEAARAAYTPVTRAIFNNPYTAAQSAVYDEIVRLVDGADAGSVVRMAIFEARNPAIGAAIQRAIARGVDVRVVHGSNSGVAGGSDPWTYDFLPARTEANADASWHVACGSVPGDACVGTGIMHNKFITLSSVGGVKDVVLITSQNWWASSPFWENAMVVVDNSGLYGKFNAYFSDLALKHKNDDYYSSADGEPVSYNADGSVAASGYGVYRNYFFPLATGKDNPVLDMLTRADCTARDLPAGLGHNGRTLIRVAMNGFTRGDIARQLAELDREGCVVQVIYHVRDDGGNTSVVNAFRCSTVQRWWKLSGEGRALPKSVHSKWFAISGQLKSGAREEIVYTGALNWTGPAIYANDESLLRISGGATFQAYFDNFSTIVHAPEATATTADDWKTTTEPGGSC
ncbi:phospholipase D-like domain-containing protein [Micromonospora sp. NPDC047074]|uniref:phospholipase D-like domain-containing protein n=1 Tax=Micromonospora sp. NPDC047074 TaxID=3154339 RepID=UPI0033F08C47